MALFCAQEDRITTQTWDVFVLYLWYKKYSTQVSSKRSNIQALSDKIARGKNDRSMDVILETLLHEVREHANLKVLRLHGFLL